MARKLNKEKLTAVEYGNGVSSSHAIVPGMFFFSGAGPAGKTCNYCLDARLAKTKTPRCRCQKNTDYQNREGATFPVNSAACKYFRLSADPCFKTAAIKFNGAK